MLGIAIAARDKGITALRMVHDCFATHASDADTLAAVLRGEFCDLYQADIIGNHHQWVRSIARCAVDAVQPKPIADLLQNWLKCAGVSKHRGPRPPQKRAFDIDEVRTSVYFFC